VRAPNPLAISIVLSVLPESTISNSSARFCSDSRHWPICFCSFKVMMVAEIFNALPKKRAAPKGLEAALNLT
jgi:hypothetical protein